MHELAKLEEAIYFAQRMKASISDREAFQYELSAFLSAARSVLQYAFKEVEKLPNGLRWYETRVADNAVLKFFKDKRNLNIHAEPIRPPQHTELHITEHIGISARVRLDLLREDGSTEIREQSDKPPKPAQQEGNVKVKIRYAFTDWSGSEDVIELCHQCVLALKDFVKAGISSGHISG